MVNMGHQCDYVVINVSSPNTPGLRDLQTTKYLAQIIKAVAEARERLDLNKVYR